MATSYPRLGSLTCSSSSSAALIALQSMLSGLRISPSGVPVPIVGWRRNASHQAQGRANKARDGPGKRLGSKRTSGEYVVPGNIIFKQRGTLWFPGDNCYMGRDHTIHAGAPGFVRHYRDPAHPKRKFIGIVFEKEQNLPQAPIAVRRRKLGMLAYKMDDQNVEPGPFIGSQHDSAGKRTTRLRSSHQYREANWEIGRAGDRAEAAARAKGRSLRVYPDFKGKKNVATYRKRMGRKASIQIPQGNKSGSAKASRKAGRSR